MINEAESWLQLGGAAGDEPKLVFGALDGGRLVWGKSRSLAGGTDEFGRRVRRFWAHALISDGPLPPGLRGASPLEWWAWLPFFASLDEAVAAAGEDGSLPAVEWAVPEPGSGAVTDPELLCAALRLALPRAEGSAGLAP